MKKITINLSYYNQVDVLRRHVIGWTEWPKDVLEQFSFCIVDDCSKIHASEIVRPLITDALDLSVYYVAKDLYCNIAGVRNLAAKECQTEWMLILDMDTIVSAELARSMLELILANDGECFKFNRRVQDTNHIKHNQQHPAICLLKKTDYWKVGGCEEDLVGHYGHTDPIFWHRSRGVLNVNYMANLYLDYIPEGESDIIRDTSRNAKLFQEKKKNNNWSSNFIRFPWSKEIK